MLSTISICCNITLYECSHNSQPEGLDRGCWYTQHIDNIDSYTEFVGAVVKSLLSRNFGNEKFSYGDVLGNTVCINLQYT